MKKLVFGLAMLASLSTFAANCGKTPTKAKNLKNVSFKQVVLHVSCAGIEATVTANSISEGAATCQNICPKAFVIDIVRM